MGEHRECPLGHDNDCQIYNYNPLACDYFKAYQEGGQKIRDAWSDLFDVFIYSATGNHSSEAYGKLFRHIILYSIIPLMIEMLERQGLKFSEVYHV